VGAGRGDSGFSWAIWAREFDGNESAMRRAWASEGTGCNNAGDEGAVLSGGKGQGDAISNSGKTKGIVEKGHAFVLSSLMLN
jgi:hypothetical protein